MPHRIVSGHDKDSPEVDDRILDELRAAKAGVIPRPRRRGERGPARSPTKDASLHIRLRSDELEALKKAAARDGVSISAFVRRAAMKDAA